MKWHKSDKKLDEGEVFEILSKHSNFEDGSPTMAHNVNGIIYIHTANAKLLSELAKKFGRIFKYSNDTPSIDNKAFYTNPDK